MTCFLVGKYDKAGKFKPRAVDGDDPPPDWKVGGLSSFFKAGWTLSAACGNNTHRFGYTLVKADGANPKK